MKKLMLTTALCIWALMGMLYAQNQENKNVKLNLTKTDKVFNISPGVTRFIHTVHFNEKIKIIIKLQNIEDYDKLKNIDFILAQLQSDIAFYKDSIDPGSGLRIDYACTRGDNNRKLRFKKYPADGDLFMVRNNDVSRLKIDLDTVSIFINEPFKLTPKSKKTDEFTRLRNIRAHGMLETLSPVQLIFCLNSYTDIDTFIQNKTVLQHVFDTLYHFAILDTPYNTHVYVSSKDSSSLSKTEFISYSRFFSKYSDNTYSNLSNLRNTIDYTVQANMLIKNNNMEVITSKTNDSDGTKKSGLVIANRMYYNKALENKFKGFNMLFVDCNVGLGLVRNTIAPTFDLGIEYDHIWGYGTSHVSFVKVSTSPYYFFDKDTHGNFIMNDNWFVNANLGSIYDKKPYDNNRNDVYTGEQVDIGIGYLVSEKGGYFKNTTMKIFTDIKMGRITLSPELIATNNFMQFFPGLRLSVF